MYDELAENVHVIQTTDTCDLVLKADYNTKIAETEKKMLDQDHDIHIYIYIYIYTNLPVNTINRLPHPRSRDSQGQETPFFFSPSADKQTRNYDRRVLKPPSLPINPNVKGIEP